ncbi:hypothetical protein Ddc_02341 [Ditylenchus destructor]|nr:hypothetical protein Ddc_02341 [Ditylenchus destructor]
MSSTPPAPAYLIYFNFGMNNVTLITHVVSIFLMSHLIYCSIFKRRNMKNNRLIKITMILELALNALPIVVTTAFGMLPLDFCDHVVINVGSVGTETPAAVPCGIPNEKHHQPWAHGPFLCPFGSSLVSVVGSFGHKGEMRAKNE